MAASYNAQITTEASHKIIVGAHLSQCSSELLRACLTYNIQQWVRLVWRPQVQAS
jgi:hypothetical protein